MESVASVIPNRYDNACQILTRFLSKIKDRQQSLRPVNAEPSPQEMDILYELCDGFERSVDTFRELVEDLGETRSSVNSIFARPSNYDNLYASLRVVEHLDAECRRFKDGIDGLATLHDRHVRLEGHYPNELALPLVQQLSRCVPHLNKSINCYRSCVRARIDALSRTAIRPLNVLDLPDELLMQVFELIHYCPALAETGDHSHSFVLKATRDIQNIRLTCRRFCVTSSHLLIPAIFIMLEPESLSYVRDISEHPTIGKGVREIEICLAVYSPQLAENLQTFAAVCAQQLHNLMHELNAEHRTTFDEWNVIRLGWREVANNTDHIPESNTNGRALQICHAKYRQRYKNQQYLVSSGIFARTIITAMARMPSAKFLMFGDYVAAHQCKFYDRFFPTTADNPLIIGESCIRPLSSGISHSLGVHCELPMNFIIDILGGLPAAGVVLKNLQLSFDEICNTTLLIPSAANSQNIVRLVKRLETVAFVLGRLYGSSQAQGRRDIHQFLSAILDTDSLKTIVLALSHTGFNDLNDPSIGPLLVNRKRINLTRVMLHGVSIHEDELRQLVSYFSSRGKPGSLYQGGVSTSLGFVRPLSGSWSAVLDSLRGRASLNSTLRNPLGAECVTMSKNEFKRVFGAELAGDEAERFIRDPWAEIQNPMYASI